MVRLTIDFDQPINEFSEEILKAIVADSELAAYSSFSKDRIKVEEMGSDCHPEIILEEIVIREKTNDFPNSVYCLYTHIPGDASEVIAKLELIYKGYLNIQKGKKYQLILKEII